MGIKEGWGMQLFSETKINNWSSEYEWIVNANKNKGSSVNRWYPILEGFSNKFVELIIKEQQKEELVCLDPFTGGGTTPLVAQSMNVQCYSFEVSPFMSQVCRAKLRRDYTSEEFIRIVTDIEELLNQGVKHDYKIGLKTIKKNAKLKKWLFHKTAFDSLLCIRKAIDLITINNPKYLDILYVTLGSLLIPFSNVIRDGKALKYRGKWEKRIHKRKDIYNAFISKCKNHVLIDISDIENDYKDDVINNLDYFTSGDCRQKIDDVEEASIDLVITSPPYLNSRDYTDSHMIELWMLGHVVSYEELKAHRRKTMRSHVQVMWGEYTLPNSKLLEESLNKILQYKAKFWNKSIPSMIAGYFCDVEELLRKLKCKMKKDGKVYINVANSSYFGIVIETDRVIEEIAYNLGYKVQELRLARHIKTSSQQQEEVKWLRESVLVLKK